MFIESLVSRCMVRIEKVEFGRVCLFSATRTYISCLSVDIMGRREV